MASPQIFCNFMASIKSLDIELLVCLDNYQFRSIFLDTMPLALVGVSWLMYLLWHHKVVSRTSRGDVTGRS